MSFAIFRRWAPVMARKTAAISSSTISKFRGSKGMGRGYPIPAYPTPLRCLLKPNMIPQHNMTTLTYPPRARSLGGV